MEYLGIKPWRPKVAAQFEQAKALARRHVAPRAHETIAHARLVQGVLDVIAGVEGKHGQAGQLDQRGQVRRGADRPARPSLDERQPVRRRMGGQRKGQRPPHDEQPPLAAGVVQLGWQVHGLFSDALRRGR